MIDTLVPLLKQFMPFAHDPEAKTVTIYITDRHPKDVMRSLSHELVHHCQNCRGDFSNASEMGDGYAQNDEHLRKMEREAYETGNMCFRDWEDSIKSTSYFEHLQKGEKTMSLKEWKNNELTNLLSEAWGFKFNSLQEFDDFSEGADKNTGMSGVAGDDKGDTEMGHVKEEELQETGAKDKGSSRGDKGKDKDDPEAKDYTDGGDRKGDESKTHKGEKDYVEEQSRTDRPDRVAGRDSGGRRLDEEGDDEIEEEGRRPRMQRQRQDLNSPVQNTRTTAPSPEEHGEDDTGDKKIPHPKVAKVAEGKMTKEQLRETLRTVLMSLNK